MPADRIDIRPQTALRRKNRKTYVWWTDILAESLNIPHSHAAAAINNILIQSKIHIAQGGEIKLKHIGTLKTVPRKERRYHTPRGETVAGRSGMRIRFKPASDLLKDVHGNANLMAQGDG